MSGRTLTVLYYNESKWEYDWILKDLLLGYDFTVFEYKSIKDILAHKKANPSVRYILIFSKMYFRKANEFDSDPTKFKFINFTKCCQIIKPVAIFYLSDEDIYMNELNRPELLAPMNDFITGLLNTTKVFIHNYNQYTPYMNPTNTKFIQSPLGYVSGFIGGACLENLTFLPIKHRPNIACFVGALKSDRKEMLDEFGKVFDHKKLDFRTGITNWASIKNLQVLPHELYQLYSNSIYVPIGRGFTSLDCYRIYEGIVAGSIPVVVGSQDEIKRTFSYNGNIIPFISAPTWKEAVAICDKLLKSPDTLQDIQNKLIKWISERKKVIRSRVGGALKN